MEPNKPDLSKLDTDRATVEIGDGRTLRLRIEPDEFTNPFDDDPDEWGQIAPIRRNGYPNDHGFYTRPDNFDGNAEKVWIGRGEQVWWQPPADGPKRDSPQFDAFKQRMMQIAEFGYCIVTLELLEGIDAYRRPIVRQAESLGGVEANPGDYLAELVRELYAELDVRMQSTSEAVHARHSKP